MNTDARFDVESHFDESWAAAYEKQIRQFCPAYDALHRMLPGWFSGVPEKARFLSAGAGSGAELLALGAAYPDAELHGVDLSADVLSVCKSRLQTAGLAERVHLHLGTVQAYRAAELFDGASSVFVAHFIRETKERLAYFRTIADCLKHGATFVFADLFGDKADPDFRLVFETWLSFYAAQGIAADQLVRDRAHIESGICFEPEARIKALLVEAGFEPPVRFFQSYLFGGWVTRKAT
jgi:tRNA (cmo5U34)-methyltransferase